MGYMTSSIHLLDPNHIIGRERVDKATHMVKSIIFETRERHSQRVNAPFLDMGTNPKIFVHNQRHNAFHTPPKGSGRNHVSNKQISRDYIKVGDYIC